MITKSYSYESIASCAAQDRPDSRPIVAFEYNDGGQTVVCKVRLEPGCVRCPACGEPVQRLYVTRRGLACQDCKRRFARGAWGSDEQLTASR